MDIWTPLVYIKHKTFVYSISRKPTLRISKIEGIAYINGPLLGLFWRTEKCRSKEIRGRAFSIPQFEKTTTFFLHDLNELEVWKTAKLFLAILKNKFFPWFFWLVWNGAYPVRVQLLYLLLPRYHWEKDQNPFFG